MRACRTAREIQLCRSHQAFRGPKSDRPWISRKCCRTDTPLASFVEHVEKPTTTEPPSSFVWLQVMPVARDDAADFVIGGTSFDGDPTDDGIRQQIAQRMQQWLEPFKFTIPRRRCNLLNVGGHWDFLVCRCVVASEAWPASSWTSRSEPRASMIFLAQPVTNVPRCRSPRRSSS